MPLALSQLRGLSPWMMGAESLYFTLTESQDLCPIYGALDIKKKI